MSEVSTQAKELAEWKKVWKSEAGNHVIGKIEQLRQGYIDVAMRQYIVDSSGRRVGIGRDDQIASMNRAQGVQECLDYINLIIGKADEKKEVKTTKSS